MTYKVREYSASRFLVYEIDRMGNERLVKTFKTRKSAEGWVRKHA